MNIISKSEKETRSLGQKFAKKLKGSDIVLLSGELGAGKTVFVKGIAKGLGIRETITSPSFVLVKQYKISHKPPSLVHIDLYRLPATPRNKIKRSVLQNLGLSEYLGHPQKICVIEWAEKIKPFLKKLKTPQVWVKMEYKGENERRLKIKEQKAKIQSKDKKFLNFNLNL